MSFILDALKKSETERQQQSGAEFASVPSSPGEPQSLKWLWILAALLGINIVVLIGVLMRPDAPSQTPAAIEAPSIDAATIEDAADAEPSFEDQVALAKADQAEREQAAAAVEPQEAAPVRSAPSRAPTSRRVRTIDELRLTGALEMTDLHLDLHVYNDVPAERFVFINMVKHREQSQLAEGPVVNEITPDGVILAYQGTTFLLPRE